MSNDVDEDMKNKISAKYKEITEKDTITDFCEQEGISESTFHKYKQHKQKIEKQENEEEENNDFENDYQPDKKEKAKKSEEEEEEEEEEEPEDIELTIG